jgi:hypothetical protein
LAEAGIADFRFTRAGAPIDSAASCHTAFSIRNPQSAMKTWSSVAAEAALQQPRRV